MEKLRRHLPDGTRVVRVMPNTPLLAGAGMCVFDAQHTATPAEYAFVQRLFGAAGEVCEVEPHAFEAATGISGCGPAFVYQFIEALADGVYELTTLEGNVNSTVKRYRYRYDLTPKKAYHTMSVVPEGERTDDNCQYKLHNESWYVFGFCRTWE